MRLPTTGAILRTFYAVSNSTSRLFANPASYSAVSRIPIRPIANNFMPIPFLSSLFSSAPRDMSKYPVQKSDEEWRLQLSPRQFQILREAGTERPFTGEFNDHKPKSGVYECAGCNAPLYKANHKYESHCGWPAFWDAIPGAVDRRSDRSLGMERIEILCSNCGGHLGHVFKGEGNGYATDERHCVNSISLNFADADGKAEPKV